MPIVCRELSQMDFGFSFSFLYNETLFCCSPLTYKLLTKWLFIVNYHCPKGRYFIQTLIIRKNCKSNKSTTTKSKKFSTSIKDGTKYKEKTYYTKKNKVKRIELLIISNKYLRKYNYGNVEQQKENIKEEEISLFMQFTLCYAYCKIDDSYIRHKEERRKKQVKYN